MSGVRCVCILCVWSEGVCGAQVVSEEGVVVYNR